MAKFNGTDKNGALLEAINKNINQLITTSKTLAGADESLITEIDGVKILTDEEDKYKKLIEIASILDFTGKDESELFCFADILLEQDKQEELFKLVNSPEIASLAKNDKNPLVFPSVFGQYGEIPGLNGVTCPRPKSSFETTESYEEYLAQHYKKFGIQTTILESGMRAAFPHEKLEWENGQAKTPSNSEYRSEYYNDLKRKHEETTAKKEDDSKEPTPLNEEEAEKAKAKAQERIVNRKKLERRVYPKGRKTLREYLSGFGTKMREKNRALFSKENWPKIKKFLIGAAITAAAVIVLQPVVAPLMSSLIQGLFAWPQMLGYALTGSITTSSGAIVALSASERIAMGLLGAAVPAGIITALRKLAKKKKGQEPAIEEEPKGPQGPTDGDDENGEGDDKDKDKDKTKGNDGEEPEITLPEGPIDAKKRFVQEKLIEIKNEIDDIEAQLAALKENNALDTNLREETLNQLHRRKEKLKLLRDKYMAALAIPVEEVKVEATPEEVIMENESGGMKL